MTHERIVEITPGAHALIESLRGFGYSPETAIADLIDNSITAGAGKVEIDINWNEGGPSAAILDDGHGMDEPSLTEAMRLGGSGPQINRQATDLGRFGMGLKTASLSQCRRLLVITKTERQICALGLDVELITKRGWVAFVPEEFPEHPFVAKLHRQASGTIIFWQCIDELSGLAGLQREPFYLRLEEIRAHLGMVFHRFLNGDAGRLTILMNGRPVKAWDPFQTTHPATRELPSERIRHAGSALTIKPYVLPHRDRFANDSEYDTAGGPGGWGARQGFYVYRGKRLLVAGSWLGLGGTRTWTRDEASRLARIEIDRPTTLDKDWRIDVRKSQARPPGALRARLTALASRCRQEAREVFAFRGRGPRVPSGASSLPAIWLPLQDSKGIRYKLNREHPILAWFHQQSSVSKAFDAALNLIEKAVPVERIWLAVSESEGSDIPNFTQGEIELMSEQLLALGKVLPETMTDAERADILLFNLPGDTTKLRSVLLRKLGEQHA
jgi:hypothetical protein